MVLPVPGLYHDRHPMVRSKGPPVRGPLPDKYGRELEPPGPIQQRAWLANKIRTDIAMMATKLNAQVIIKNLQNMHEKSLPPTGRGEGWNWSIRTGPACKEGDHTRADLSTAP